MNENDRLAERYHQELEEEYEAKNSTVSFEAYQELDEEKNRLLEEYRDFQTKVFELISDNKLGDLMEYLKEKGIW